MQCDIGVPEILGSKFVNFPPIFKNTSVSRSDIGDWMKNYAEEERSLSQAQKMLISCFTLQNGTLITPLLLFCLQLGLVVTKIHRFVEYTPKSCFNSCVQAAGDARRKSDENPNSSVVAEAMKFLANSSYGYQIMDRSRHTVTMYLTDEKTHAAVNSKLFKKLDYVNNSLYEVELAKAQIEHKETIIVGLFILPYAKMRKNANVGALLQLLHQILWSEQVRRVRNGHRFAVSCCCWERTGRLYRTRKESRMAEVAIKWLCQ